jgi:hypothetical protein
MSEQQQAEATETGAEAEKSEQPKPSETVDFWKQKAREQEKRAKENADAAKRLAEIEEAQKSEAEKAADAIAEARREAEQARLETQRYRIATEFELAAEDVAALEHAASEEGMRLIAERLAAKTDERKKNGNVVPNEGKTPREPAEDELKAFTRQLFGAGDPI